LGIQTSARVGKVTKKRRRDRKDFMFNLFTRVYSEFVGTYACKREEV